MKNAKRIPSILIYKSYVYLFNIVLIIIPKVQRIKYLFMTTSTL